VREKELEALEITLFPAGGTATTDPASLVVAVTKPPLREAKLEQRHRATERPMLTKEIADIPLCFWRGTVWEIFKTATIPQRFPKIERN
jgi:hypothetical protein